MAAVGVMNAIGVISGVLGIADFLGSNFAPPEPQGASVQVKVGLQCPDGCSQFGGEINSIQGFDANNAAIGGSSGGFIGEGGILQVTLDQAEPGKQVDFLSVSNSNDATCIAWISVRNFDGIEAAAGAWNGDIGQQCGQTWFAGNQIAGRFREGGDWRPACSWLDGDFTDGIVSTSLKFNVQAYGDIGSATTLEEARQCTSTIYSTSGGDIAERPAKRSMIGAPRKPWMEGQLIVSESVPNHNATFMCQSETSWGPDFIGSDGFFCDMGTRELIPLCSTQNVEGCVDVDATAKALKKRTSVAKRQVVSTHKDYGIVNVWS